MGTGKRTRAKRALHGGTPKHPGAAPAISTPALKHGFLSYIRDVPEGEEKWMWDFGDYNEKTRPEQISALGLINNASKITHLSELGTGLRFRNMQLTQALLEILDDPPMKKDGTKRMLNHLKDTSNKNLAKAITDRLTVLLPHARTRRPGRASR